MPVNALKDDLNPLIETAINERYEDFSIISNHIDQLESAIDKHPEKQQFENIIEKLLALKYINAKLYLNSFKTGIYVILSNVYTDMYYSNENIDFNEILTQPLQQVIDKISEALPHQFKKEFTKPLENLVNKYQNLNGNDKFIIGLCTGFDTDFRMEYNLGDNINNIIEANAYHENYLYYLDDYMETKRIVKQLKSIREFLEQFPNEENQIDAIGFYQELLNLNQFMKTTNKKLDQWYLSLKSSNPEVVISFDKAFEDAKQTQIQKMQSLFNK